MAAAPENYYVVIIAGGVGTRLWPKSREKLPKQFFHLQADKSLSQMTYERLGGFLPDERIFVVAPTYYQHLIAQELPNIPKSNYILEPEKKGTTAANITSALYIKKLHPDAIIHFVVADDHLTNYSRYQQMSLSAHEAASKGEVVVFGVRPSFPNPGLGYIEVGKQISKKSGVEVFKAEGFVEKPDEAKARRYFDSGNYYVHGSGFCAQASKMASTLVNDPKNGETIKELEAAIDSGLALSDPKIKKIYSQFVDDPIESSFLEKIKPLTLVTLQDSWNDVGSWSQVYDIFPKDKQQNVLLGNHQNIIVRESSHNIIFADKHLVAVTNLRSMVVVDTQDAVLICPMADSQHVKQLVEIIKERKLDQYL